ncbi:wHTH domain-containing protein [Polaromonas glacialis]|uniref:wHTH domain-containing protein n=1 Tax=Polaromonas glacialis TaxID=866564 RepID=UPI0018DDD3CA|nr:metallophosphoesterase [Polaromonas glacialis]
MVYRLRILHISDLHERVALSWMKEERLRLIEVKAPGRHRVLQASNFEAELLKFCRSEPIDLICFTGDIADWGLKEEYDIATDLVRRLLKICGLSIDRFFVVPGNHDILRTHEKELWEQIRAVANERQAEFSDWLAGITRTLGEHPEWRATLRGRSQNFWNWVTHLGRGDLDPRLHPHRTVGYRSRVQFPGFPFHVNIVGLDTAWLAGGDDDAKRLQLTENQIELLASDRGRRLEGPTIALMHHPLTDLADEKLAFNLLAAYVDVALRGHMHDPGVTTTRDPDRQLRVLAAGSLYEGDEGPRWINGFQVIELSVGETGHPQQARVKFWAWSPNGHWHPSGAVYRAASNGTLELDFDDKPGEVDPLSGSPTLQQGRRSPWCVEIEGSPLWQTVADGSPELATGIRQIVWNAEAMVHRAVAAVPTDRWRDLQAPARVIRQLLVLLGDKAAMLSPAEAAIALVVPHVYEAILAAGTLMLTIGGDPLRPLVDEADANPSAPWIAWRNSFRSEEMLAERHAQLWHRGAVTEAEDLAAWCLNRFLHVSGELWEYVPDAAEHSIGGWINADLGTLFALPEFAVRDDRVSVVLGGRRIVQLARLMYADFEEIEAGREPLGGGKLLDDERIGPPPSDWHLHEATLAHLLSLAASMSADPRRLDRVLVDHLGLAAQSSAAAYVRIFAKIGWYAEGTGLVLGLVCPHEAVDLAAQRLVEALDAHGHKLAPRARVDAGGLLSVLPRHFSDLRVTPEEDAHGRKVYIRPHLQFILDHGRVMQLLMGKELYGRPELALRELYQNAMDACRLRRARTDYLRLSDSSIPAYTGLIVFRAGYDEGERQRTYVECVDDGIGMTERHLRSFFAQAGRRFTDSHEFHVEKAAWSEMGIEIFPNSRFGIGVFSYFMVAEELLLRTRRLSRNGVDRDPGVGARVIAGSNLFRIQRDTSQASRGTSVRLYLRSAINLDELLESMHGWLWLPEFETKLERPGQPPLLLEAGQPAPGFKRALPDAVAMSHGRDRNGHARFYWHSVGEQDNAGALHLLVDGVSTAAAKTLRAPYLLANLNEDLRPELKVDRSEVTSWPRGFNHLTQAIRDGGWHALLDLPKVDLFALEAAFEDWLLPLAFIDRNWRSGSLAAALLPARADSTQTAAFPALSSMLLKRPIGVAPMLDAWLFRQEWLWHGRGRRDEQINGLTALFCSSCGGALARWLAARAAALAPSAVLPEAYKMLGLYAAQRGWSDVESLGLRLLSSDVSWNWNASGIVKLSLVRLIEAADSWALTLAEIADLARPLADLGVVLPDVDHLARCEVPGVAAISLLRRISGNYRNPHHVLSLGKILSAALSMGMSMADISQACAELRSTGLRVVVPPITADLSKLTADHRKFLDQLGNNDEETLQGANCLTADDLQLVMHHLSCGASSALECLRSLPSLGFSIEKLEALGNDPLRLDLLFHDRTYLSKCVTARRQLAVAVLHRLPLTVVAEAALALRDFGFEAESLPGGHAEFVPGQRDLDLHDALSRMGRPWTALVEVAAKYDMTWGDVEKALARLPPLAGETPPPMPAEFQPTQRHVALMASTRDSSGSFTIAPARLVTACVDWSCTLGDVLAVAEPLAALGVQIPPCSGLPANYRPDDLMARLLSRRLDGREPWRSTVPPGQVVEALSRSSFKYEAVVAACASLHALGIQVPTLDRYRGVRPTEAFKILLSEELDGQAPWVQEVNASHLVWACGELEMSLGIAADMLLVLGALPEALHEKVAPVRDFIPEERHLVLLTQYLRLGGRDFRRIDGQLPLGHLLNAAVKWSCSLQQVMDWARPLEMLGVIQWPHIDPENRGFAPNERHLILLSRNGDGHAPWYDKVDPYMLRTISNRDGWKGQIFIDVLQSLARLGIQVPPIFELTTQAGALVLRMLRHLPHDQNTVFACNVAAVLETNYTGFSDFLAIFPVLEGFGLDVSDARSFIEFWLQRGIGPG